MARSEAHTVRNQTFRKQFSSVEAAKGAFASTAQTIETAARSLNLPHTIQAIPNAHGAKLHLLGDRTSRRVLLYLHGGGYALPPLEGMVTFPYYSLEKAGHAHDTSLAYLEYSLSDVAKFPTQMIQATESLRYLLSTGFEAHNVIIAGDSAGGNMCFALVSNILHPYPDTEPLILKESLAGLLMISPWVSCDQDTQSYKDFAEVDIVPASLLKEMGRAFLNPSDRNAWTEPYLATPSWWANLPAKKTLIVFGGSELFRDHISKVGKDIDAAKVDVKTVLCEDHVHDECLMDHHTGLEPGKMAFEIWDWLKTTF